MQHSDAALLDRVRRSRPAEWVRPAASPPGVAATEGGLVEPPGQGWKVRARPPPPTVLLSGAGGPVAPAVSAPAVTAPVAVSCSLEAGRRTERASSSARGSGPVVSRRAQLRDDRDEELHARIVEARLETGEARALAAARSGGHGMGAVRWHRGALAAPRLRNTRLRDKRRRV